MKLLAISTLAGALFLSGVAGASPAVTVIGGGMARDCYLGVESGKVTYETMEICNLALSQERLSTRDRAATYVNRGILHMRQGRLEMALADYDNGARLAPNLPGAQINRGAALYNLQRYDDAMEALNRGLTTDEADPEIRAIGLYNRALTHEKLGDVEAAYYDFKAALDLDPAFELASLQLQRFEVVTVDD